MTSLTARTVGNSGMQQSDREQTPLQTASHETFERLLEQTASGDSLTPQALRKQLEHTATEDTTMNRAGRFLDQTATDISGVRSRTATDITDFAEGTYTPNEVLGDAEAPSRRFELLDQVGKGGTARVYAMRDNNLRRTIAVKFLGQQNKSDVRRRFVHEAQVTAMLEHPNIMPVYDLGMTQKKQVYFTMKKVGGVSLGEAIRHARHGEAVPEEFKTLDGRVRMLLKVCDALAFAHSRGFVHQDIKPDNIMLGEFGEVLVLDWGSAVAKRGVGPVMPNRVYGTPAYMAPEQARREAIDERTDVYCLGGTMLHALLLRHPSWADNAEAFWEKKREGILDPVTDAERKLVPARLLNIAVKALSAIPEQRYQSIAEMADDLKRYQAGMAVRAYRETVLESFLRWYRRNQRLFWMAAVMVVGVGGAGGLLFREKIQEMITWRFWAQDDFAYADTRELSRMWRATQTQNWRDLSERPFGDSGSWFIDSASLVGRNLSGADNITFVQDIPGDIRVEWNVTPLAQSRDLNCYIGGASRFEGYMFHVGGYGDPSSVTLTRGRDGEELEVGALGTTIALGNTYRMRMELEANVVRFFCNGHKSMEYADWDLEGSAGRPTFGFENNQGNSIRIDDVKVYYHPLPLRVTPLAAADRFVRAGYFEQALALYSEVVRLYPDYDIAAVAMFKSAECLMRLDSVAQAIDMYHRFERTHPNHPLVALSAYGRYRVLAAKGDSAAASNCLLDIGRRYPDHPVLRTAVRTMSIAASARFQTERARWGGGRTADTSVARALLAELRTVAGWARALGVSTKRNRYIGNAVDQLYGRGTITFDQLLTEFPEQRGSHATALLVMGNYTRVLRDYADQADQAATVLFNSGRYEDVLRKYPQVRARCAESLLRLGRLDEVLARYRDQGAHCAQALWRMGRIEEALAMGPAYIPLEAHASGNGEKLVEASRAFVVSYARALMSERGQYDSALAVLEASPPTGEIHYHLAKMEAMYAMGGAREAFERFYGQTDMDGILTEGLIRMGLSDSVDYYFPGQPANTAWSLYEQGRFDEILQPRFASAYDRQLWSLWQSDKPEQIAQRFPGLLIQDAAVLIHRGQFAEVLRRHAGNREACAKALFGLRRYNDLLAQYPDQRTVCAAALFAMGQPEQALAKVPESRAVYAQWLIANGRASAVVDSFADQHLEYVWALLELGREQELSGMPWRLNYIERIEFSAIEAIVAGRTGDWGRARAALERPCPYGYNAHEYRFARLLLAPIIRGLAGDTAGMRAELSAVSRTHERVLARTARYEAGLLAGIVSEEEFLHQPVGNYVKERMVFMKAIRADVAGDRAAALQLYRAVAESPHCRNPRMRQLTGVNETLLGLFHTVAVQEFIRWRIATLST